MSWILHLTPFIDLGGFFSSTPTFAGSIFAPPPPSGTAGTPVDTATSVPATFLTLTFTSSAVPPTGPSAVLVTDTAGGDVLRSGPVGTLPASPASAAVFTPLSPVTFTSAQVAAAAPTFSVPPTPVPVGVRTVCGILSAGTYIPLLIVVPPITVTLGSGAITATAGGSLVVRVFYFFVSTMTITVSASFAIAPSGDPTNKSRVLSVTPTASSITGVPGYLSFILAPVIAQVVASIAEGLLNGLIASMAGPAVASAGFVMSPTAVISAKGVTITPSGMALRFVLADLFGPGVTKMPGTLSVSIAPGPMENVVKSYTATVVDSATGSPPPPNVVVTVRLDNYRNGTPAPQSQTTTTGQVVFSNVRLEYKTVTVWELDDKDKPHKTTERISPTLTVSALGYNTVELDLI